MKVGITCGGIGPYANGHFLQHSARAAEAAGFAHYWIPDHVVLFAQYPESTYPYAGGSGQESPEQNADAPLHFDDDEFALVNPRDAFVEPVVAMTWLAAATSTMEVGTNILVLPQRNPVLLAKELSTLDEFSRGRVILGIGAGWAKEDFDAMGIDFKVRGKRTDEMIAAMRTLWDADAASFQGEFFSFNEAYCYPKPARPGGIPILVGGESKPAMRRVAKSGNGWLPYNLPVEDAPRVIGELKDMTRAEGRDPEALRIIKIVYSNAALDNLKRYRDAGVTEFNVASSGEIPFQIGGINAKFAEFGETIVGPIGEL